MAGETLGKIVFVGDEVTAMGFRLAGVETCVPRDGDFESALAQAQKEAALVIVTAEVAAHFAKLPKYGVLFVVGSARGDVAVPDFSNRVRRELGILP